MGVQCAVPFRTASCSLLCSAGLGFCLLTPLCRHYHYCRYCALEAGQQLCRLLTGGVHKAQWRGKGQ
jgi:hypothetical protein